MSNLLASLRTSAHSLAAFERSIAVTQNNVNNAMSPAYARQQIHMRSNPFDLAAGLSGGVSVSDTQSLRSDHAERSVRRQVERLGSASESEVNLKGLEAIFTVAPDSGIGGALNNLFSAFSAWSVAPNSQAARENVMDKADGAARSFRQAAADVTREATDTTPRIEATLSNVMRLAGSLREINIDIGRNGSKDAGLDARMHEALEQLSELIDIEALHQEDGTVDVLVAGQTPLVLGDGVYRIALEFEQPADPMNPEAMPHARIIDVDTGRDITANVTQGKLGALLDYRNNVLTSIVGDAGKEGELNQLARRIADRMNEILTTGWSDMGSPPQTGVPLFVYGGDATSIARTLSLNSAMRPALLAAIDPGPPMVSNGAALKLAGLAQPTEEADKIEGMSYASFYGRITAEVGATLGSAKERHTNQIALVNQVRAFRAEISGVSLDEEAINLVEFQRAFQATSRMISILDELTEDTINMIR